MDEDGAVRWAIRRDGGPLSPAEQSEFEAWLAADERREGALLRAEAALAYLDRARALGDGGEGTDGLESDIGDPDTGARFSRRLFLGGGVVAGAAAAGLGALLLLPAGAETVATGLGEVRRMPLADGSVATINTASRIAVSMEAGQRLIRLDEGEAWFQVAHDRTRPFLVDAGRARIRAVGTAFSVRRHAAGVDILVTEGVVEIWAEGRPAQRVRAGVGARAFVPEAAAAIDVAQSPDAVERALAWRNGELALSGETLAYAVSELNRYNQRKIVIDDARLEREPIVGYFRTNQPENFARTIAPLIGARLEIADGALRLVPDQS